MNDFLIKNYISKITTKDIDSFARKNNIELTKEEIKIIDNYIKNDWKTIIYGNSENILNELKQKLDNEKYQKIEKLYIESKNKYKNYL